MQDPAAFGVLNQGFAEEENQQQLKCPRCDSLNTKFCYYNNYNLSQPRYYCKACRRYWTKGGSLRNIPVGGASRKPTKRSAKRPGPKPEPAPAPAPSTTITTQWQQQQQQFGGSGCLLQEGLPGPNGPGQANGMARNPGSGLGLGLGGLDQLQSGDQDSSCNWSGNSDTTTTDNNNNNGWPDLAVYTPDSRFQ